MEKIEDQLRKDVNRQKAVREYINLKHNADECSGFIDGYEQCQKDRSSEDSVEELSLGTS